MDDNTSKGQIKYCRSLLVSVQEMYDTCLLKAYKYLEFAKNISETNFEMHPALKTLFNTLCRLEKFDVSNIA